MFYKIFSSLACLFVLLMVSFAELMFLISVNSSFIHKHTISFFQIVILVSLSSPRSPGFSSLLSSRSFLVLHFALRSMIHFELIFVKCVRSVSRFEFFFFPACLCPLVKQHLLKTFPFAQSAFALLLKISCLVLVLE